MRSEWPVLLVGIVLLGGCASSRPEYAAPIPVADCRLLFDPYTGFPSGADLVYRSDWPSADRVYQGAEYIAYRESIYDIQGLRNHNRDLTFRRFRMDRVGTAQR